MDRLADLSIRSATRGACRRGHNKRDVSRSVIQGGVAVFRTVPLPQNDIIVRIDAAAESSGRA